MPTINELRQALFSVQKPGRYTGGEPGSVIKDKEKVDLRFAFCFPDTYEIGMSFLGEKILYELLNRHENWWCERAFMPWVDMKEQMETLHIPLYCLESKDPLRAFDIVGFSLEYELCYTNVLAMLELSGIPLRAADRDERWPLIIAGGPCVCNAEPMADFFDVMQLGEGEQMLQDICACVEKGKKAGWNKEQLLAALAGIPGVYVPSFYDVSYEEDGRIRVPARVTKAIVKDMDSFPPPENFVVPIVGTVQDRASVEVLRGCVRGCRFCQAGQIYRPFRERSPELISSCARTLCANTGYDELSLMSLSTSDHSRLEEILDRLNSWAEADHVSLSLPSLRVDNFSQSLVEKTSRVRKSGLTFAAEAGTQRLRDVINKNVTWEQIERGQAVFHDGPAHRDDGGYQRDRRYGAEGRRSVLHDPGPPQRQGRTGHMQRGLLCAQALDAVPVLRAGHARDPARKAEISALLRPFPQDQGELPRQRHQCAGRDLCQGRPPPRRGHRDRVPQRFVL